MSNNTTHDWTIHGNRPEKDGRQNRILTARSPCGRIEIEVHQDEGYFWNPTKGEREEGTHFIVSVYESQYYNYHPKYDDGEWIEHELVAHLRPTTTGQGWAPTYDIARNLVINGILSIEKDDKWISGSLSDSHREYVHPHMDKETVICELRGMFRATGTDTDTVTRDKALSLAREYERFELAEYLYSLTEDDFWWLLMDVETKGFEAVA